jgi:hypothetical protein
MLKKKCAEDTGLEGSRPVKQDKISRHSRRFVSGIHLGFQGWIPANNCRYDDRESKENRQPLFMRLFIQYPKAIRRMTPMFNTSNKTSLSRF